MISDEAMLRARTPIGKVRGPYIILHKEWYPDNYGWSICALHYEGNPRLGIRWWAPPGPGEDLPGYPGARNRPQWFILPYEICEGVLSGLPIHPSVLSAVRRFLAGEDDIEQELIEVKAEARFA